MLNAKKTPSRLRALLCYLLAKVGSTEVRSSTVLLLLRANLVDCDIERMGYFKVSRPLVGRLGKSQKCLHKWASWPPDSCACQ